jgi:hypothetical protein
MNELQPAIDFLKRRKYQIEVAIQALERVERSHGNSIVNPPAAGALPIKEPSGSGGIVSVGPKPEVFRHEFFGTGTWCEFPVYGGGIICGRPERHPVHQGALPAKPDEN